MNVKRVAQDHSRGHSRAGTDESQARAFPVRLCHLSLNSAPLPGLCPGYSFSLFLHLSLSHGDPGLILLSLVPVKFF